MFALWSRRPSHVMILSISSLTIQCATSAINLQRALSWSNKRQYPAPRRYLSAVFSWSESTSPNVNPAAQTDRIIGATGAWLFAISSQTFQKARYCWLGLLCKRDLFGFLCNQRVPHIRAWTAAVQLMKRNTCFATCMVPIYVVIG